MSSFCMGCGNSLSKDERYCGICGRDSQAQAAPVDPSVAFGLPPETSGKAIFSLVTGFLFFFLPFAIVSLVFGYLSLYDIRKSAGQLTGRGLAITGIVLGYLGVVVTIGVIGFGHLQHAIRQARGYEGYRRDRSVVSSVRTLERGRDCLLAGLIPRKDSPAHFRICPSPGGSIQRLYAGRRTDSSSNSRAASLQRKWDRLRSIAWSPTCPYESPALPAYCSDESDVIRVARNGSIMDCLKSGVDLSQNEVTHPKSW